MFHLELSLRLGLGLLGRDRPGPYLCPRSELSLWRGLSLTPNQGQGKAMAGLKTQSNAMNSSSYEEFINCVYSIVLKLTVFTYFAIQYLKVPAMCRWLSRGEK